MCPIVILPTVLSFSNRARVALKIIKNIDRYREAALSEVEVLKHLNSLNTDRRW